MYLVAVSPVVNCAFLAFFHSFIHISMTQLPSKSFSHDPRMTLHHIYCKQQGR